LPNSASDPGNSYLAKGKEICICAITADTALRLGKYFGTSPDVWIGLQKDCELRVAKQTTWADIADRLRTLQMA